MRAKLLVILCTLPIILLSEITDTLTTPKTRHYVLEGIRVIADQPEESIGSIETKNFNRDLILPEFNLAGSINDINGVTLTTGGKSGADISIRGFTDRQIKIMLDGRPLGKGYFGTLNLNTIPLSEIKEIHVLKGPISALYGSDTMGGVVNIITRSPSNEHLLKTGFLAKRNNTNKLYLSTERDMGEWDYWVYFSRYNTEGFMLSDDFQPTSYENGAVRDRNARQQYDLQGKLNWTMFDHHSFGIQASYTFMDKYEITSSIYENRYRQFTDWQRYQLSGMASLQLSPYILLDSNIYYDQNDDTYAEYSDPDYENMFLQWPSELSSWTFGVFEKLTWDNTDVLRTIWGYRYEKQVYNRKDNGQYPDWTSNHLKQHNFFLQTEYKLKNFTFSLGSGYSLFKQKARVNWRNHFEPAAGLYYTSPLNWKLSLAYAINTKYPTLHELFSATSGNPELQEESAQKYEISLDLPFIVKTAAGSISQKLFYNQVKNLINKTSESYENLEEVNSYGFEISVKLRYLWEHKIDYFLIKYTDESDYQLLEVAENTVNISQKIDLPYAVRFEYNAAWKDQRKTEIEGQSLAAYWLHSIYFSRKFNDIKVLFGLENLFDKDHMEQSGYPGEGLNFVFSLEAGLF